MLLFDSSQILMETREIFMVLTQQCAINVGGRGQTHSTGTWVAAELYKFHNYDDCIEIAKINLSMQLMRSVNEFAIHALVPAYCCGIVLLPNG